MRFRNVGPYRGGRVCAVTGVRGRPSTYYFGSTGGGVWKTDDAGVSWEPISDRDLSTGSVGAIAVAPSDAKVIYVGTGESQMRGNVAAGDGVYRSTDAGKSWLNVGLRETQHISRVVVDPRNADTVYVAALGHAWGPNPDRGVYRSRDGGGSWRRVLFIDDKTGAADLAMDPHNPRVLYAALWQAYRAPWSIESGGPASGLYKSTDGGDSWTRLAGGLPQGIVGRIGVAVSPAREDRVWAIVEAADGGLYRSDDGGLRWQRVSSAHALRQRAWYYSWVYADPRHPDTVYLPNVELNKSIDGGRTFTVVGPRFSDNHDLWIDPDDPDRMILGNDGGARVTWNGGRTWSSEDNQPTAQIYRVATDGRVPYWLYGAQQDKTTIAIPSAVPGPGIGASDWHAVGGGECGWVAPDPRDPEVVYAGGYGGEITRYDHRTRQAREIAAWPQQIDGQAVRDLKYRWNWNAPILVSRHEPHVLYHAAQVLLRSADGGETWQEISPDLTRNDRGKQGYSGGPIGYEITGVEVYDTIFALAESPHDRATLWAGSDDGLVHLTRDGGKSWRDVTPMGLPEWIQINSLEASPHDPASAYLAATLFKLEDRRPYLYKTNDYGKTWSKITTGIPAGAFTRAVREDPMRRGLLYAGTETGLYVSLDDGASWQPFQLNLPAVPITDLQVAGKDLVVATQGRAFWILDDLTPLRRWRPETAGRAVVLFRPQPASRDVTGAGALESLDADGARHAGLGENPPAGLVIYVWLAEEPRPDEEVTLEILAGGKVIRRYSRQQPEGKDPRPEAGPEDDDDADAAAALRPAPKAGLNRFVWDLRMDGPKLITTRLVFDDYPPAGVKVAPGAYTVRLRVGTQTFEEQARVLPNPRVAAAAADLERQAQLLAAIHLRLAETHELVRRSRDLAARVRDQAERAAQLGKTGALEQRARELAAKLDGVAGQLWNPELQADEDSLVYTPKLDFQLAALAGVLAAADARPTPAEERRFAELDAQLTAWRAALRAIWETDLPAFKQALAAQGVPAVMAPPW
ncbi:MAG: glycosyl hydrolase [Acidobacteria bacterium]|nr:glycosyl hydrolase [Acidobacteriota bacterium]